MESMLKSMTRPADKVHMVRYADDFVITGSSKELLENRIKPAVTTFLRERGLTLSEEKTAIVSISQGFDFLGFNIHLSLKLVEGIRRESANLIEASSTGCNKAGYRAATYRQCQKYGSLANGMRSYSWIWLLMRHGNRKIIRTPSSRCSVVKR